MELVPDLREYRDRQARRVVQRVLKEQQRRRVNECMERWFLNTPAADQPQATPQS